MFLKSFNKNHIFNNQRNHHSSISNINDNSFKFSNSLAQNNRPNNLYGQFSFKIYKPNHCNYINYTLLKNHDKDSYINNTSRDRNSYAIKKNSNTFKIVNNNTKYFLRNNKEHNSYNNMINNKNIADKTHYEKKNRNQSTNNIFLQKFNKYIYDIKQGKEQLLSKTNSDVLYIKNKDEQNKMIKIEKLNFINKLNKNSGIPINKRIKILKQAKYSINQMKKNSFNSFASYKSMFDNDNKQNSSINSYKKNQRMKQIRTFKDISDRKPIIIKLLQKPKLTVPKFININKMKIC